MLSFGVSDKESHSLRVKGYPTKESKSSFIRRTCLSVLVNPVHMDSLITINITDLEQSLATQYQVLVTNYLTFNKLKLNT